MRVATHDGKFHADDVLAVAALKELGLVSGLIRTRDPAKLTKADMRLDVGRVYDHQKLSYDHHQTGGAGKRPNGIPYAAFGLIWHHYGEELAGSKRAAEIIDRELVQPMDAEDSGMRSYRLVEDGLQNYTLGTLISRYNPRLDEVKDVREFDAGFRRAVRFARTVLKREIERAKSVAVAEAAVEKAVKEAADPRVIVLDRQYAWERLVVEEAPEALYVVYPTGSPDDWRAHDVPLALGSFESRRPFPLEWAGKENEDLAKSTGVPDARFCHTSRFLVTAKSKEAVLSLVNLALEIE